MAIVGAVENANTVVLVTLGQGVLDRRTLALTEGLTTHPHHHEGSWAVGRYLGTPGARPLSLAEAIALVRKVRAAALRGAKAGLAALAKDVDEKITAIAIRACPPMPKTIEACIRDHRAQTVADSVMYRQALAAAATARGWKVHWYERDRVAAAQVKSPGPPWTARHRLAAAAARAAGR